MTDPSTLPVKPDDVAQVTDAHWAAALDKAFEPYGQTWDTFMHLWTPKARRTVIDHARCLILLKEVPEPLDPLEAILDKAWEDMPGDASRIEFNFLCRKYFAGITFPETES